MYIYCRVLCIFIYIFVFVRMVSPCRHPPTAISTLLGGGFNDSVSSTSNSLFGRGVRGASTVEFSTLPLTFIEQLILRSRTGDWVEG